MTSRARKSRCAGTGGSRRRLVLAAGLALAAGAGAQEYVVLQETWRPAGLAGWTAPGGLLELSAPGGDAHAGALCGRFAAQVFAFPDSDAFTASSGASMGRFAQAWFAEGRRLPLWIGFDLQAVDVVPSSCLLRLTGGVGTTYTFFRSVLPQVGAKGRWSWIEAPLDDPAGWTGGTPAQFTNMLSHIVSAEVRLTRNGLAAQEYRLDNFTVVWRIGDPLTDTDGDGLPDTYELAHTGSATGMSADGDDDDDGYSNKDELDAGSDPRDAGSRLAILRILKTAAGAHLLVRSLPGRFYQIEQTTDLTREPAPEWETVGPPVPGDGTRMTLTDDEPAAPARFYRIKLTR